MRKQGKGTQPAMNIGIPNNGISSIGRMQKMVSQTGLYAAAAKLSSSDDNSNQHDQSASAIINNMPPLQNIPSLRTRVSGAINALSLSPDREAIVVAGRDVLKIFTISSTQLTESLNLRAGSQMNINSSNDVKWGNNATKTKVATAATNGSIIIWDINKIGRKTERIISEHSRAVNRICFQQDNGNILLSASQDGTMRCWDLRDMKTGAKFKFEGKSESVRDVQFNPINYHDFAAAFETGTIQKWDMRNPKAIYDRKVSAHNGPCLTVDWHPTGRTVASGGRDKTIKVWDMGADNRRPLYTMRTMASVFRVQWRPGYDDEVASCALLTDQRIHIWDVRRPSIAKYAFDEHESTPTGFIWYDSDTLFSVAKDKYIIRQEIQSSYQIDQLLRRNAINWNIQGDVSFVVDKSINDDFVNRKTTKSSITVTKKNKRSTAKLFSVEEAVQYIPLQSSGIVHLPLFDYETFSIFAENYEISSDNIIGSCEKNSQLAWKVGNYRTSQTWKIIALLFQQESGKKKEDNQIDQLEALMANDFLGENDDDDSNGNRDIEDDDAEQEEEDDIEDEEEDGDEEEDEDDDEDDDDDDEEDEEDEEDEKYTQTTNASSQESIGGELWPTWKHDNIVMDLLDYYTEQGDVQMCVTIYLILERYIHVDDYRLQDWFNSYIDMLHRFKLWSAATSIIKACKIPSIQNRNQMATTINIACNNCFKLVSGTIHGAWACDKCHRLLNPCSICHQIVKGLYVWCQGCNHGGHIEHLREWFSKEKQCPTGCSHNCVLNFLNAPPITTANTTTTSQ